ncbi:LOW QUALITY PROTEIN: zinc transporter ZIP4 [Apteryx mantelli]|uniref:LOW QUALITY PROTEIN: zinc transporter ZIP4 n=1 Tax=Apteryx mantelli TaxID=2696672 RepID=A0ABM4E7K8_9AVES
MGRWHPQCSLRDAARVLAESAAAAPRVGAGLAERVLATLGAHAVRGSCLRALPPPGFFLDYIFERFATAPTTSRWRVCLAPAPCWSCTAWAPPPALSRADFTRLGPALLQQQLSGACSGARPAARPAGELSTVEKYVYGSLATLVVCLCSLCGITLLLCTACAGAHRYVIQLFVSLAVGSLTGDALLHLVPQFLGLHSHADGAHGHGEAGAADATWKLLAVLGGLYGFFLLEKLFSLLAREQPEAEAPGGGRCEHAVALQLCEEEMRRRKQLQGSSCSDLVRVEDAHLSQSRQELRSRELRMLPYMITAGDAIHNFADGLAMGAAFAASWRTGLATSLAVLCHELPHELAPGPCRRVTRARAARDFAALLHAGLSVRRALLLNGASALTAFLGLYIALAVATGPQLEAWIFTVATGLFLYVALCDMLPAMMNVRDERPWLLFALHNVGLLTGWAVLLLLSLYEDNIVL